MQRIYWNKGEDMPDIQDMIGRKVDVFANGIIYSGELIEVSDVEVYLKGSMQWLSLPASSISEIRLAEPGPSRIELSNELKEK